MKRSLLLWYFLLCSIFSGGGCDVENTCESESADHVSVVLTFDDGPLAADQSFDGSTSESVELLQPLRDILMTLERRGVRAAFFVEGPGYDVIGDQVAGLFGEGLKEIYEYDHVLGYHAFNHAPAIWSQTLGPPLLGRVAMENDLDRLVAYIDDSLETVGGNQSEWFTPLFRQPFGGSGLSRSEAQTVAIQRGWVYRGFIIDSIDWTDNFESEPALADSLPFETKSERIEFVRRRIRSGIFRNWDRDVIDILLHVNAFTAANLDNWIDEIEASYAQTSNATITFDVPECYVETPDTTVDRTLVEEWIRGL